MTGCGRLARRERLNSAACRRAAVVAYLSLVRSAAAAWMIAGCMMSSGSVALLALVETADRGRVHRSSRAILIAPADRPCLGLRASAAGSAALPAGLGLAIGAVDARILALSLLVLGLAMGVLCALLSHWSRQAAA
jgi:hypothetical protein